ncbi:MAG TPA: tetratricopeptide repeat protein, partial [Pirellulales bacterium]
LPRAITQLTLATELAPNDRQALESLLECYGQQDDVQAAVRCLTRMLEFAPRDLKLWNSLGNRLDSLGQPAEAQRAYTSMVEMLPHEAESHERLAQVEERLDHWPRAIAQWRQAVRLRKLDPTGLLGLAQAQIHEKQFSEARQTLELLKSHAWPERFDRVGVDIEQLEKQLRAASAKEPPGEAGRQRTRGTEDREGREE